jgi:hypothetical protein
MVGFLSQIRFGSKETTWKTCHRKILIFRGTLHFQTCFAVLLQMPPEVKNLYSEPVVNFLEEVSPQLILSSSDVRETPEACSASFSIQFGLQG